MSSNETLAMKLDPRMAIKPADTNGIAWHLPFIKPMELCGFNWFNTDAKYERLPIKGRPDAVTQFPGGKKTTKTAQQCGAFALSANTAGGQIRFRTDSSRIVLQGEFLAKGGMDHMAFTGSAGFDVYLKNENGWTFYAVTRTNHDETAFSTTLCQNLSRTMRDVLINFPLYNGVQSLAVGLDDNAAIEPPTPFADPRPVVFYGTSITQGGCATRPGMASSNILSRMLDMEVINLGFSGNGKGEPELAHMLADVKTPALYLIDYCWNVSPSELKASLPGFIDIIRKAHPNVPVMLLSPTPGRAQLSFEPNKNMDQEDKCRIMRDETKRRYDEGDTNIFFFDALHESMGPDFSECTVDCCHLTDLGFLKFSQAILPAIKAALRK